MGGEFYPKMEFSSPLQLSTGEKSIPFIRVMILNRVKPRCAVTFMKYLASVVCLIFLPKTLIWNKVTFPASNLLSL